jgi:tetratricopeptide (TPR) repeat protein
MHNQGRHELSLIRGIDSLVFYINKTVFPAGLSAFYQRGVVSIAWHEYLVATAVLLILAFFATRSQNNKDAVFFGGLFFLATIFPVLQIVPFGNDFAFADRFMYLPSVGIFYFVSVIWLWFFENRASVLKIVSCGAVIALGVLFSYTSFKRSLVWANSQSLWEDEVAKYPNSSIARNNLGSLYLDRGRYDEAIAELKASAELKPTYVDPHVNLGVAYLDLNKLEEAQKELEQAIRLDPNTPKAHLNLGVIAEKTGNLDAAFFHYKEAVRMDPEFSFARHNLGVIYYRRHDVEKALEIFRETVKMDPTLTETYHNIGVILLEKEQIDDAIKAFNESARLDPYYLEPHLQLFRIYQKLQRQELVVQEGKTIQDIQNRVKNNPRPRSRRFK